MARRGRRETAGQYAARDLRRLVIRLAFAAVELVLFIYVVGPFLAGTVVANFSNSIVNATRSTASTDPRYGGTQSVGR